MKTLSPILLALGALLAATSARAERLDLPPLARGHAGLVRELACISRNDGAYESKFVIVQRRPGTGFRVVSRFLLRRGQFVQVGENVAGNARPIALTRLGRPNGSMLSFGSPRANVSIILELSGTDDGAGWASVRFSGEPNYVTYQRCISFRR